MVHRHRDEVRRLAAALTVLALPSVVSAQEEEAFRFQYDAPAECPNLATFAARVRERTSRGRPAEEGELARTFAVRVRAASPGFVGELEFLGDSTGLVSRQVRGEQCDALVTSLALITALALDAAPKLQEPERRPSVVTTVQPATPGPPEQVTRAVAPAAPVAAVPTPRGLSARVGGSGAYSSAIGAWTYGLLGQLDWADGAALRFVVHYALDDRTIDAGRRAELRLLGLHSSYCPLTFPMDVLALTPCAGFDFGSLRARGVPSVALPQASSDTIAWAAAGPELRLSWEPVEQFWLELDATAQFPLVAHEFRFALPSRSVYEVPQVAGSLAVATGVRF